MDIYCNKCGENYVDEGEDICMDCSLMEDEIVENVGENKDKEMLETVSHKELKRKNINVYSDRY